jgi:hypothetical protein
MIAELQHFRKLPDDAGEQGVGLDRFGCDAVDHRAYIAQRKPDVAQAT